MSEELTPEKRARLAQAQMEGDQIRDWCRMPGFKLYKAALEARIDDHKKMWLRGSKEEAEEARIKAQGLQSALDELKKFLLSGDNAKRVLAEDAAPAKVG